MEKHNIKGSTRDLAELVVDYEAGTTDIKGIPEETIGNRLKTAFLEWVSFLILPFGVLLVVGYIILSFFLGVTDFALLTAELIKAGIVILFSLTLCHLNKRFDKKVKTFFAKRSGDGKRNRICVTNLKNREFVLFDITNHIVDYKATKDYADKLAKVWVKKEHISSLHSNQGTLTDLHYEENRNIWNAHFIFREVPKDGELWVEWI